jgi:WhiB family redox-sensing transcriptional regulator
MIPNLNWLADAACAGMDQRAFFATGNHARAQVFAAKKICDACPVREECRGWAIESGERWGVWGGMSQHELRKKRRRFTSRAKTRTVNASPKNREPAKCGTNSGYRKHLREKTKPCDPCRKAHAADDARLRRTGTTKVAS